MDILRFVTSGSVDDGKSTLVGRLLLDTKSVTEDQIKEIEMSKKSMGISAMNLALLTDGLKSEREQGITIDVAYRYFSTKSRKFILADSPGHLEYTRNMVTAASTADLTLLLVDARQGLVEQTKRHSLISSLLGIKHLILCINKMDLVDFNEECFMQIRDEYLSFASKLEISDIRVIPISALAGDNVVAASSSMPWYKGETLLKMLENLNLFSDANLIGSRFPVQLLIRPLGNDWHDYKGYAGRIESGSFSVGDEVVSMQTGHQTTIKSIRLGTQELNKASAQMSVVMTLKDDINLERGDLLARFQNQPQIKQELEIMLCWMHEKPLDPSIPYILKHNTRETKIQIKKINYKIDVNTLDHLKNDQEIRMNDISHIQIYSHLPVFVDSYRHNRTMGSAILIDPVTNQTVAGVWIN
jgi:sulfate adenylyltransferase subunit 1